MSATLSERRDRALQDKFEFHLVWYPYAKPYVEVWRRGGKFETFKADTIDEALELAITWCKH